VEDVGYVGVILCYGHHKHYRQKQLQTQKYWQELNLAVGPKITIATILSP
jgi:hypothetical protein